MILQVVSNLKSKTIKMHIILLVFVLGTILSCSRKPDYCYQIGQINIGKEDYGFESIYYLITDKNLINQLTGPTLVADNLETKYERIIILNNDEKIETNNVPRVKKTENGIFLVFRTSRFLIDGIQDSLEVAKVIKNETLLISLTDKSMIKLENCN